MYVTDSDPVWDEKAIGYETAEVEKELVILFEYFQNFKTEDTNQTTVYDWQRNAKVKIDEKDAERSMKPDELIQCAGSIAKRAVLHILQGSWSVFSVVFACHPRNVPFVSRFRETNGKRNGSGEPIFQLPYQLSYQYNTIKNLYMGRPLEIGFPYRSSSTPTNVSVFSSLDSTLRVPFMYLQYDAVYDALAGQPTENLNAHPRASVGEWGLASVREGLREGINQFRLP